MDNENVKAQGGESTVNVNELIRVRREKLAELQESRSEEHTSELQSR